ncbi:hypothetical protein [Sphingomonas sp. PP-F2F-G114-C0414]|uniref:hypothetical protein n=1 Tax=Sphingomonas sp. PP-F2F-G114-C0414 TaxID=2135662 RepID=UPI0011C43AC8|nr:hypothetical protein [Sphingomonas sp. PP-F2F-G114-C0414]
MSSFLLALSLAADPLALVGDASDKLSLCVFSKTEQFSPAHESAETTVNAALAACLTERADFRTALRKSLNEKSPSLSKDGAREVEQKSYDLTVGAVRDQALVRIVTARAKNAKN